MNQFIDKKMIVSLVIAGVIVFLLQKYLTKKVTKSDGTTSSYVGHEAVGFM